MASVAGWVDGKVEFFSRRMVGWMVLWVVEPENGWADGIVGC